MICDALLVSLWVAIGGLERSSEMDCISMLKMGVGLQFSLPSESLYTNLSLICAGSPTNPLHPSPDAPIEADTTLSTSFRILNTRAGPCISSAFYIIYHGHRLEVPILQQACAV